MRYPSVNRCLHCFLTVTTIILIACSSFSFGYYQSNGVQSSIQPGLWRSSLSQSSYYYADYKVPMVPPQKDKRFIPDHPECPDSGGTLCKDVPNYPIDHIYDVIKSARANGFNFTSLFVDESKGDLEPNLTVPVPVPVSREKPHVKSYIVYQTSLQYDYLPHHPYQETHHQGFSLHSHQTYQPQDENQHQLADSYNDHQSSGWDNFGLDSIPPPPPVPQSPSSSSSPPLGVSPSSLLSPLPSSSSLDRFAHHKRFAVNPWKPIVRLANVTSIYAQRHRRRRRSVARQQSLKRVKRQSNNIANSLEGEEVCRTRTMFLSPRAALNDKSEWKYVVNLAEKDANLKQVIKVDVCQQANSPCSSSISLPFGFKSRCKQKFIKKKLLSLDPDGSSTSSENFFVPSCCVCEIVNQLR
ncbi:protein spaetzle 5 [Tetranychus urticae]|uniref:Spaetzle domain-containing protein n=1 Tax=Tetranychus urticae TaxID=32264 RepID=T1K195_TETUR|nr:protein spaetzle 5 [Tetranychus urticae]XP_025015994.1 protein spaetzle 5 [Tetranychus urticae]